VDWCVLESFGSRQTTKTATNNHNARSAITHGVSILLPARKFV